MEEKITSAASHASSHASSRLPLGMNSFGVKDQQQFGLSVRLAMACVESSEEPTKVKAMPSDEVAIRQRLQLLSQEITSHHADLLELLVRFDDMKGWESSGAKYCAAWMNLEIGIGMNLSWEYLSVGRKLRLLPLTTALFRAGKISWSKIRLIVKVADADNEKILCHAALDASVTEVKRLCKDYQWKEDSKEDGEKDRALKQRESRSLSWSETSIGSTCIKLTLPPEVARAFLNSVEYSFKQLETDVDESDVTISQRRADAAVLMAESSLQAAGREIATADRYQVIVSVNESNLRASSQASSNTESKSDQNQLPSKRPTVKGVGSIARETARRIACDCSVTHNTVTDGEPTDIGRKSRLWPPAMARAIKERDQHCQFNGCSQTQNLQIHHLIHWADGGSTSVSNGICLCQTCHTKVHEGGYSIQKVDNNEHRLNEQFVQQRADDNSLFDFEKNLRSSRQTFDAVRKLSPTRFRFRVLDVNGFDIRDGRKTAAYNSNDMTSPDDQISSDRLTSNYSSDSSCFSHTSHSTRVGCAEPATGFYNLDKSKSKTFRRDLSAISELPASYNVNVFA